MTIPQFILITLGGSGGAKPPSFLGGVWEGEAPAFPSVLVGSGEAKPSQLPLGFWGREAPPANGVSESLAK